MSTKTLPYYNFDKLMSYNAVYNFVIGGRGMGKTYGAKVKALRAAITRGDEFVYLRRYRTEMVAKNTFFADIADEFPDYEFRVNGMLAQFAPLATQGEKKREWRTAGYFVALSTAQSMKSIAFPKVKTIIFDEFIIEKGAVRYLPDEAKVFNNFYSTIDRWKDKTRVFFLANSVSIMNPYFIEYDVKPEKGQEFIRLFDGFMVVNIADSAAFGTEVFKTRFGSFVQSSEYADYAVGNAFADNNDRLLAFKSGVARYMLSLETKQGTYSIWYDALSGLWYAQQRRPGDEIIFTMEAHLMSEDKYLVTYTDKQIARLRSAFRSGKMFFDAAQTRNALIEIFRR